MSSSHLDKVMFVCKLLLDQRLIELKKEHEKLKKPFEDYELENFHSVYCIQKRATMSSSHLDKVMFVSKLLLDQRLIELKKEHEKLKKQFEDYKFENFHSIYGFQKLTSLMKLANREPGPSCKCRYYPHLYSPRMPEEPLYDCKFILWIEEIATQCGIKIRWGQEDRQYTDNHITCFMRMANINFYGPVGYPWFDATKHEQIEERKKAIKFFDILHQMEDDFVNK